MNTNDITAIQDLLNTPKNIVIVPHKNPDGDAIGSTLALYHYLIKYKHKAQVISPNDCPEFLNWVPGNKSILKHDTQSQICNEAIKKADIIFTLDFNAYHRSGTLAPNLEAANAVKILIDHHQEPDNYADFMFSDVNMSSTCEMVYHFINMLKDTDKIDVTIATCLYLGIMTDTGSFRFASTTSTTHKIVAKLIDKGVNNAQIHNNVYNTNSYNSLQLLGCALSNLKIVPDLHTAYITLSQNELRQFDYKKGDTEGIVNYALSLKDIIFAAIFIEDKQENIIKISFRSKGEFSVNKFSRTHFNGGGHNNAAGGRSESALQHTVDKFLSILPNYKNALNYV